MEKHLEHQKELYYNFIDFRKPFDHVWHERLFRALKECSIDDRLIEVIKSFYDETISSALLNGNAEDFLRMTVGVRQGCPQGPVFFSITRDRIIQKALILVNSLENDRLADGAVEKRQKKRTSSCLQCPLEDDRFPTFGLR